MMPFCVTKTGLVARLFAGSLFLVATSVPALTPFRITTTAGLEGLYPLIRAIYVELGYDATFTVMPNERAMREVDTGNYDAEIARIPGILAPYPNLMQTKEPVLETRLMAWVKRGSLMPIRTAEDLGRLAVGYQIGNKLSENFIQAKKLSATGLSTQEALAKMLDSGRLQVVLLISAVDTKVMAPIAEVANRSLVQSPTYHVLNLANAPLAERFDAILRTMKKDGRYERLLVLPP